MRASIGGLALREEKGRKKPKKAAKTRRLF